MAVVCLNCNVLAASDDSGGSGTITTKTSRRNRNRKTLTPGKRSAKWLIPGIGMYVGHAGGAVVQTRWGYWIAVTGITLCTGARAGRMSQAIWWTRQGLSDGPSTKHDRRTGRYLGLVPRRRRLGSGPGSGALKNTAAVT